MDTQQLLKSSTILGLALPRTERPSAARAKQVARPVYRPIGYQPDTGEQIVFALLGFAALFLILLVFL